MVQTGQFVHDYLGNPDMDMASIAKGFGVDGEIVESPAQLREALARARKHTVEGKPYLIDVQVARKGVGWADKPWVPPIQVASMRQKKCSGCRNAIRFAIRVGVADAARRAAPVIA